MSYYIIGEGGQVMDVVERMDNALIQREANLFGCSVYAIQGEHSGFTAEPETPEKQPCLVEPADLARRERGKGWEMAASVDKLWTGAYVRAGMDSAGNE